MKKQEKTKTNLVKINSELYNAIKATIGKNKIDYPSIKYFVEKAVEKAVGFKKYDIEGIKVHKSDEPLKNILPLPSKNFCMCFLCDRAFLKDKEDKSEVGKICPNCKRVILYFADEIIKEKSKKENLFDEPVLIPEKFKKVWRG